MTDTVTPASLRAHADWMVGAGHDRSGQLMRQEAARLEAESARDEEAARIAQRLHERLIPNERARSGKMPAWFVPAIRELLDILAADGRLLPEGGTEEAAQTCEEMCEDNHAGLVCTRLAGHLGRHVAHNEEDQPLHAWSATPPAVMFIASDDPEGGDQP